MNKFQRHGTDTMCISIDCFARILKFVTDHKRKRFNGYSNELCNIHDHEHRDSEEYNDLPTLEKLLFGPGEMKESERKGLSAEYVAG